MKKLLMMAAAILFFAQAQAQVQNVQVTNNTPCTVYFVLHGNPNPGCGGGSTSAFIALAPFSIVTYDATVVGLAAGDDLVGADIWDNNWAACAASVGVIGEICYTGGTTSVGPYNTLNGGGCAACFAATATWGPGAPATANLDFN